MVDPDPGATPPLSTAIRSSIDAVRSRIVSAGGDPERVTILGVTKTFPAAWAAAAFEAGLGALGENYAGELVAKAEELAALPIAWHYLGSIQTNKVPKLVSVTTCFQGVSRVKEAAAIAQRHPGAAVMIQVELTGLADRNGCPPDEVPALVAEARRMDLDVTGLMTVAPIGPEAARQAFRTTRAIADDLGLRECSMGMTDDLELAVEEGSTMVRIGRALFGARPPRT
jgi:pyridoxal phosphate enzyme (YggS family)